MITWVKCINKKITFLGFLSCIVPFISHLGIPFGIFIIIIIIIVIIIIIIIIIILIFIIISKF